MRFILRSDYFTGKYYFTERKRALRYIYPRKFLWGLWLGLRLS